VGHYSNAEIRVAKDNINISKLEYERNYSAHYPIVNLIGTVSNQMSNTASTIDQQFKQSYIGVQVNVPLYSGGEIKARSDQSFLNFEKAQFEFEVVKSRVVTELRKQFDAIISGQKKIQALQLAQESGEELVKAMRKSVLAGERANVDVLLSEKSLFNTRRDLAQVTYGYFLAYLKLNQLSGNLEVEEFQKIASYFK
jgi:protease secretion system outer membrane protein